MNDPDADRRWGQCWRKFTILILTLLAGEFLVAWTVLGFIAYVIFISIAYFLFDAWFECKAPRS